MEGFIVSSAAALGGGMQPRPQSPRSLFNARENVEQETGDEANVLYGY